MKILTSLIMLGISISLFSQNDDSLNILTTRKNKPILPQRGDLALGLSANPFLEYFGNFLGLDHNLSPYFSSNYPGYIMLKYLVRDDLGIRTRLTVGSSLGTHQSGNAFDPQEYDTEKYSSLTLGIDLGIEKYKGFTSRFRGYYGIEAGALKSAYHGELYQSSQNVNGRFVYENATLSTDNFVEKGGNVYTGKIAAFIGLEYFFAPKISISGEFSLQLLGSITTDRVWVPEEGDEVVFLPGSSSISLSTSSISGIGLYVYF